MIKESIPQEDIILLNAYVPNKRASNYVRQKVTALKGKRDESTIIVGVFNTPLSEMDRSNRQKIRNDTVKLTRLGRKK